MLCLRFEIPIHGFEPDVNAAVKPVAAMVMTQNVRVHIVAMAFRCRLLQQRNDHQVCFAALNLNMNLDGDHMRGRRLIQNILMLIPVNEL